MTTTDWRALPAGRELDALVAELMGWTGPVVWVEDDEGRDPYLFAPDAKPEPVAANDRGWDCRVPHFSTDTDEALSVWQHMARSSRRAAFECAFQNRPQNMAVPFAICRAALAATPALPGGAARAAGGRDGE